VEVWTLGIRGHLERDGVNAEEAQGSEDRVAPVRLVNLGVTFGAPNHSLERTQPQRDFMYDVAMLRRSARSR